MDKAGFLEVRESLTWELLDGGASDAFAVADHQIAHIYVNNPRRLSAVKALLEATPGVERVLDEGGKKSEHIDHERAGDLIAIAEKNCWFSYYYWLDEQKAPDFAPTVDIHRKPGFDPAEMFFNPRLRVPAFRVLRRLLQKKLGFRMLMDVVSTNGDQVAGSHGRRPDDQELSPVVIAPKDLFERKQIRALINSNQTLPMTAVNALIQACFKH